LCHLAGGRGRCGWPDALDRANRSENGDKLNKKRPAACNESQTIRLCQKIVQQAACGRSSGYLPPTATFSVRRVNFPLTLLLDMTQRDSRTAKTSPTLLYIAPTISNNAARRRARAFVRVRVRAHFFGVCASSNNPRPDCSASYYRVGSL